MGVRLRGFGSIEVDGVEYEHDIVIDAGKVTDGATRSRKLVAETTSPTPRVARGQCR
jgi:hypothetical protein